MIIGLTAMSNYAFILNCIRTRGKMALQPRECGLTRWSVLYVATK